MAAQVVSCPVILLGASSQIGLFAVPRLVAAGHPVVAISRGGRPAGYPEIASVHWTRLECVSDAARQADCMVSAGPLPLAVAAMDEFCTLKRVIAFSTTSVLTKADSPDRGERQQVDAIRQAEARFTALCGERGFSACLLRPTLVYGAGLDRNVSFLADWARKWPLLPIAGDAPGLRQPVHADDLARAAVAALGHVGDLPPELSLAGGSTVSFRCMVERIIDATRANCRVLPVPPRWLVAAAFLARILGNRSVSPAMVRRQAENLVFDDGPARDLLGYAPRPFRPAPGDFGLPSAAELIAISKAAL